MLHLSASRINQLEKMSTIVIDPFLHFSVRRSSKFRVNSKRVCNLLLNFSKKQQAFSGGGSGRLLCLCKNGVPKPLVNRASSSTDTAVVETSDVLFSEKYALKRTERVSVSRVY